MTISYTTATKRGGFFRLLFKWKGSIWKSIWRKLLLFSAVYTFLSLLFRFALKTPEQRALFTQVAQYFDSATTRIPLTFVLGFYVSQMVSRWWTQFERLVWPDQFMMFVTATIQDTDDDNMRRTRRTLARYVNLACALVYRNISVKVLKRLPSLEHLVKCGLMTSNELTAFNAVDAPYGSPFIPLIWATNILAKCQKEKVIDSIQLDRLLSELASIRSYLGALGAYDWIPVPLIYTQVATLATYGYFVFCTIGRQYTEADKADMVVPIFTVLEFVFYMGWLQVAEDLFNPFGEDDEDFEMNYIMDRNLAVAYMIGDTLHANIAGIEEDSFWNQPNPRMPHTVASRLVKENYFKGHLADFKLKEKYTAICESDEQIKDILRNRSHLNRANQFRERILSRVEGMYSPIQNNNERSLLSPAGSISPAAALSARVDLSSRRPIVASRDILVQDQSHMDCGQMRHIDCSESAAERMYDENDKMCDEETDTKSKKSNINVEISSPPIKQFNLDHDIA